MTAPATRARWLMSFADLCLLLLGFFVILSAGRGDPARLSQGMRSAFGSADGPQSAGQNFAAASLFEPREAVLRPAERAHFQRLGTKLKASGGSVAIISEGTEAGSRRLDGWELSAARTAAIARAIQTGGMPADRIAVSIPALGAGRPVIGQRITLVIE